MRHVYAINPFRPGMHKCAAQDIEEGEEEDEGG
jgi:hypothetical protein